MFKISTRLVTMLYALPRENEYIFGRMKAKDAASYFCYLKKRAAQKLQNPRFLSIRLHTFRLGTPQWNTTRPKIKPCALQKTKVAPYRSKADFVEGYC